MTKHARASFSGNVFLEICEFIRAKGGGKGRGEVEMKSMWGSSKDCGEECWRGDAMVQGTD